MTASLPSFIRDKSAESSTTQGPFEYDAANLVEDPIRWLDLTSNLRQGQNTLRVHPAHRGRGIDNCLGDENK